MFGFFRDSKEELFAKNFELAFSYIPKLIDRHSKGGAPFEFFMDNDIWNEYLKRMGVGKYKSRKNIPSVKSYTLDENPNIDVVVYAFKTIGVPAEPMLSMALIEKETKLYRYYIIERSFTNALMMTSKDHSGDHYNYGVVANGEEFLRRSCQYMMDYLKSHKKEDNIDKEVTQSYGPWEPTEEQLEMMARISGKSREEVLEETRKLKLAPDLSRNNNLENKLFKLACRAVGRLKEYKPMCGNDEMIALIYFSSLLLDLGTSHGNKLDLDVLEDRYFLLLLDHISFNSDIDDVIEYINTWSGKFRELLIYKSELNRFDLSFASEF